ncbi:MAG: hypothetical protein U0Q18_01735 [Bryobacteraceae bacterium]
MRTRTALLGLFIGLGLLIPGQTPALAKTSYKHKNKGYKVKKFKAKKYRRTKHKAPRRHA